MRTSIRLRLLTLMLIPAIALVAFAGLQLRASLELERRMAATTMDEVAALSAEATRETFIVGGVALAAVIFTFVLLFALTRGIVDPLQRLTSLAGRIAETLPEAVGAVLRGEEVPEEARAASIAPELLSRRDELGGLARALGAATEQATTLAVEQARIRRGVAQTISDVARREQSLVERQLSLLEAMEDREEDPEQLQQLFRLDHLATRMRRNAENLLLLSAGQMPGSADTEPLALVDVIRSAAAETEEYPRVDVRVGLPLDVLGYVATPLSHLLAELIENATTFSPPSTRVTVTTRRESAGVAVTIVDQGLGMGEEDLADARQRLIAPPLLEAAESRRLGLYVVGLLAQKLGVAVDLRPGDQRGLEVHVWLPDTLFTSPPDTTGGPAGLAAAVQAGPAPAPAADATGGGLFSSPAAPRPEASPAPHAGPQAPVASAEAAPAAAPAAAAPAVAPQGLEEEVAPDALSAMQRLLDATPSAPPPLPDDVQAPQTALPTRAPALPQRQAADEGSGLSLARASGGHTVELDPSQVSQLMRSFSDDLGFGASSTAPPPTIPSAANWEGGSATAPPPSDAGPAANHVPQHTPAPQATPQSIPTRRSGGTSSWSTPFPTKGLPR